jgi:hypothetical protein
MNAKSMDRVQRHTSDEANESIRKDMKRHVAQYMHATPAAIERRLQELDREWDIERALQANAATVSLLGLWAGATVDRRYYGIPAMVAGFLFQHAVSGWCPPLPVFRSLGFRTRSEIEQEKYALKALRGDFKDVLPWREGTRIGLPRQALEAVGR